MQPGYQRPYGISNIGGACASVAFLQLLLCAPAICEAILAHPAPGVHTTLATILDKIVNQGVAPLATELRRLHKQLARQAGYAAKDTDGIDCAELFATCPEAIPALMPLIQLAQSPVQHLTITMSSLSRLLLTIALSA